MIYIEHKNFRRCHSLTFSNDIVLLRLSSEASLTVTLASLPPFGEILPHNIPCCIAGYGRTSSESDATPHIHNSDCKVCSDAVSNTCIHLNLTVHICLSPVHLQLVEVCLPEWGRPSFLLSTTRAAPAPAGGTAPPRPAWSVLGEALSQDATFVCWRDEYENTTNSSSKSNMCVLKLFLTDVLHFF